MHFITAILMAEANYNSESKPEDILSHSTVGTCVTCCMLHAQKLLVYFFRSKLASYQFALRD